MTSLGKAATQFGSKFLATAPTEIVSSFLGIAADLHFVPETQAASSEVQNVAIRPCHLSPKYICICWWSSESINRELYFVDEATTFWALFPSVRRVPRSSCVLLTSSCVVSCCDVWNTKPFSLWCTSSSRLQRHKRNARTVSDYC